MQTLRRLTKTLSVSLESFLDEIQNHEASVAAALREVERGSIRIRAQRAAAERRLAVIEQSFSAAEAEERVWRQRALRLRNERDKALECLRRSRLAGGARAGLDAQCTAQRELLEQLAADERSVELKLSELRQRRASLVSREARASAGSAVSGDAAGELELAFDGWQARIEEREASSALRAPPVDAFARALSAVEEQAALELELTALLRSEGENEHE